MKSFLPLGICAGYENAAAVAAAGADFLEVNVQSFLVPREEDDARFAAHGLAVEAHPVPIRAANCFLPGDLPCVGPAVDEPALLAYAGRAFTRASAVGIEHIVFGSGAARNVPTGFDAARARRQIIRFLEQIAPLAARAGVTIVIEPLNSGECNFINTLAEGAAVAAECGHPNVGLLGDTYHMGFSGEGPDTFREYGEWLRHVHVAEYPSRRYPGADGQGYQAYFQALREIGYEGRVSVECRWDDLAGECGPALANLRRDQRAAPTGSA